MTANTEIQLFVDSEPGKAQTGRAHQQGDTELQQCNLAEFFGNHGPLAQQLDGYELRPSQLAMAEAVKQAILQQRHALIEAPTGTGKSIAYLAPAILSGKTVIVATANKSLQSQIYFKDIPFLRKVLNKPISAVIVKGRSNFVCNYKWEKEAAAQQQIALYDREHDQVKFLREWLDETDTGDIDDLPFMLDTDLRPRIVSYPDDCLHQECRFYYDDCWVNHMRDKAAEAQILITNHHLLLNALELGWAGERILPPAPIYIIDEAHGLEQTATAVFETSLTDYTVEQLLTRTVYQTNLDADEIEELRFHNTLAFQEVAHRSRENAFRIEGELEEMKKLGRALGDLAQRMRRLRPSAEEAEPTAPATLPQKSKTKPKPAEPVREDASEESKTFDLAVEALSSLSKKLLTVASSNRDADFVRYAVRVFDRRHTSIEVHAAPINPASLLEQCLFHPEPDKKGPDKQPDFPEDADGRPEGEEKNSAEKLPERTVICTSATLATNGNFFHFKQRCGIQATGEEHVLPAVFNYPQQALLYQPPLPAYDYRNADSYYSAVSSEIERLLEVSRGRALCLFTSWSGLQQVQQRLAQAAKNSVWPLRAQGEAPRDALLSWFKETPYSVLLATRSFWEGVDIPGDNLSLVVLDKMPFPTPGDPLHSARMKTMDDSGGNSFGDYMLPLMNLALKQGFGRLIRRATDRGVVAILDERLSSKSYGRQTRQDLPPARFSREFKDVHKFFQVALQSEAEFAINVWSRREGGNRLRVHSDEEDAVNRPLNPIGRAPQESASGGIQWRWQLLRMQDGKADSQEGVTTEWTEPAAGALFALLQAFRNLRQRIERAERRPTDFSVEVRWRLTAQNLSELQANQNELYATWQAEQARWQAVKVIQIAEVGSKEVGNKE